MFWIDCRIDFESLNLCLLYNVRCISFTFACSVMSLGSMRGDPSKAGFPSVNMVRMIRLACILHYYKFSLLKGTLG